MHRPWLLLCLLAGSTGFMLSSTTLLPSTFAMYCMTAATAGALANRRSVRPHSKLTHGTLQPLSRLVQHSCR